MDQVVTFLVKAESKWLGIRETSEWFSRAGRNIKTGLIASSGRINCIVSCIGLDLGGYLVTIIHRCILIWNKWSILVAAGAHKVLLFFALMTNTIVTTMLVLGSAAVVSALTSVHTLVAAFLIPIGVIIYTFSGGLKATFFADYLNSALLFVVILIFVTIIYFNNSEIGGISGLLEKLVSFVSTNPVQGKAGGA